MNPQKEWHEKVKGMKLLKLISHHLFVGKGKRVFFQENPQQETIKEQLQNKFPEGSGLPM